MQKVHLKGIDEFAKDVLEKITHTPTDRAYILALQGDLGAGKTTFTQALARVLGIVDVVQSPTYVLMKSYPIHAGQFTTLTHIDAYRLDRSEEFRALKPETFLSDPSVLVVLEWPERVHGVLPEPHMTVRFSATHPDHAADAPNPEERYIEVV